jgi:hypothetical protein
VKSPSDKDEDRAGKHHWNWPTYQPEQMMFAGRGFQYAQNGNEEIEQFLRDRASRIRPFCSAFIG